MSELITERLRRRVREAGADPLLTYYDLDAGERTELSAVTFANWVDKTSNLLVDELLVEAGQPLHLPLAGTAPGHWVTAVWAVAAWQVGLVVTVGSAPHEGVVVSGPDWQAYAGQGDDLVVCSLHPLGLGLDGSLSAGAVDYGLEVRGQPDRFAAVRQSGLADAWVDPDRRLTQADLLVGDAPAGRHLVRPTTPWATLRAAIVRPLVSGGSSVVVTGVAEKDRLRQLELAERVDG